ncbi:hypothetical protein KQI68_07005 [Peptoniphilus sp. MSJ-1]|uniref:Uncharacterized protein n=1 Tax=Peptoniphilus ovalis TaxID=2841503 RepID=A0ABS6FJZ3_9FIRM|nr:hypothetical protein [Peptoniphilus ovalis]MBU5669586.1 hypothetical protein [Peptoniphilus ovalis]
MTTDSFINDLILNSLKALSLVSGVIHLIGIAVDMIYPTGNVLTTAFMVICAIISFTFYFYLSSRLTMYVVSGDLDE